MFTAASCQALMLAAGPLSKLISGKRYTDLSEHRKLDWRSRVVSFIFATSIIIQSVRLMLDKKGSGPL